jgi:type IV pilus assembly protein PilC
MMTKDMGHETQDVSKNAEPKSQVPGPSQVSGLKSQALSESKEELTVTASKISRLQKFTDQLNSIGLGKERNHFIENLAILLNSGLSVIDALKTIQLELRIKPMKKMVQKVIDDVESGIALWRAMDNRSFFTPYALSLIRIGEESGSLSKNMEYLSVQQEKDRSLRSKVKMAMIYPSIVLTLTMGITLGLAWFVLPQLVGVLLSLNAKLPLVTRIIIWVANFFKEHGIVAVPLFGAFSVFVILICKYTSLKGPAQMFAFRLPGIGVMARSATLARFGIILGSLLRAGVPLVESIRSMADVTDTIAYRKFYERLAERINVGCSFAVAFADLKETSKLIPVSVQQLLVTGEKSGKIADMLLRVADIYEKKAEEAAQRLPVVLEPILLLFIGGLVGTIAFAIIVPIYSIVGSVGR